MLPLLLWLLLYVALRRPCLPAVLLGMHMLECVVLLVCARIWMLSTLGVMSLLLVVLAANTALWGWRRLPMFVPVAGLGLGIAELLADTAWRTGPIWLDAWSVCGGMLFVLVICAVSHSQAEQLVGLSRHLRREKHTLLRYLPSDLPDHLQHQQRLAMRRQWVTVVFIDLVGFTRTSNELPPEALAELLNRFMTLVDDHVERWGGHVSKFLGDGVLCVFPSAVAAARRNAAAQAVRCVGLLPAVIKASNQMGHGSGYGHISAVRCGVASGYCCSGDWGGGGRLDYTVIGPPVNLAQRLQAAASEFGGVLLDETTQRLVEPRAVDPPADRLDLKGLGRVPVYRLLPTV